MSFSSNKFLTCLTPFFILSLTACGGGGDSAASSAMAPAPVVSSSSDPAAVLPLYHRMPDALPEPDTMDADGSGSSAYTAPSLVAVSADVAQLNTQRLTDEAVAAYRAQPKALSIQAAATTAPVKTVVYTPAQIRAAYGLPALPASYTNLSPSVAASLGAGQTLYILDVSDNINSFNDLNTFSKAFALPTCTAVDIPVTASLPLSAASMAGCTMSKVYTLSNSATRTATAPAYNSSWAGEIALDIQWAHAIAPLARLVLIETPDTNFASLNGALTLVNKMGPGTVSMSWGTVEGSWELSYEGQFTAPGVTYFAAAGDAGTQVNWPSSSPNVAAVGGTTLAYTGVGSRSETVWSGTGGGTSAFEPIALWQKAVLPTSTHRRASDVAFNANPSSGQYGFMTPPGAATGSWYAYGGTSISTPQWAALAAVANAMRAVVAKPALGSSFLSALYTKDGAGTSSYSTNFLDVSSGADGSCAQCSATVGFDGPTGQGTPNASALLAHLQAN